jgi:chaperonin GroEL (HSP60 family)
MRVSLRDMDDLMAGFILDKKIGVNQPKRLEKAKILVANTPMDTDKVKVFGARVRVDATGKLAELERAEKVSTLDALLTFRTK